MTYNKPDTKLDECIFIAEKIIPADLCDAIVKDIETREWKPHKWYNPTTDKSTSEETKELDIQVSSPELHKTLVPFITNAGRMYNQNYAYKHPSCADRTGKIET
jgi:hypothetical protein